MEAVAHLWTIRLFAAKFKECLAWFQENAKGSLMNRCMSFRTESWKERATTRSFTNFMSPTLAVSQMQNIITGDAKLDRPNISSYSVRTEAASLEPETRRFGLYRRVSW